MTQVDGEHTGRNRHDRHLQTVEKGNNNNENEDQIGDRQTREKERGAKGT